MDKEKIEPKKVFAFILLAFMFIAMGVVIIMTVKGLGESQRDLTQANKLTLELQRQNQQLVSKLEELGVETEKLRKAPHPVDAAADELLTRDIFIYIDKKFQLVPQTAAEDIAKNIVLKSREHGVSPELVVGIVEVESGFNASAVSSANARGLMQVMPEWAKKFGLKKVSDLHDIDTGIECGIKVLKIHIEEEGGNLTKGLFKYVGGSDAYAGKVYTSMGKFVAYRSFIPDNYEKQEGDQKDQSTIKQ